MIAGVTKRTAGSRRKLLSMGACGVKERERKIFKSQSMHRKHDMIYKRKKWESMRRRRKGCIGKW